MTDRHYFINCRGADFFPSYESVWNKSGGIPTVSRDLFNGLTESMNSDHLMYNGSTRISTWVHFNEDDITNQIKILKSTGINLLRIHLDLYAWASLGDKFIARAKIMARLVQDQKMYIQWVLFESNTKDDIGGADLLGRIHEIGGLDPNNLSEAMEMGLHHYQRCPTVYKNKFLSRHPDTMVVSGNTYFEQVIGALSPFKSTKSWEVMANVEFNPFLNPADLSAYAFLTSAVDKANSLVPVNQQVTVSFNKLSGDPVKTVPDSQYPVDLYFLIGDSLATGGGTPNDLVSLGYSTYRNEIPNAYIFHPSSSAWSKTLNDPQYSVIGSWKPDNLPRFEQYVTEHNTDPVLGIDGIPFGYELILLPMMGNHHNRPSFLVKVARGSSTVADYNQDIPGNSIFPSSMSDWDTNNDKLYYRFINFLSSGIDILTKFYGEGRVICRAGIISLGTNPSQNGGESQADSLPRTNASYSRIISGIRNILKVKKVGTDNTKIVCILPDTRLVDIPPPAMYSGFIPSIRNFISSGLSDRNIIPYDPSSSTTFIDSVHYNSSSVIYIGSSIANILISTPEEYNIPYSVSTIYNKLDFICYNGLSNGFIHRTIDYLNALSASVLVSKPILAIGITKASDLVHLETEIESFNALKMGFITGGIIDRNLSNMMDNDSRGILFSDGTTRDLNYTSNLRKKAISDLKYSNNLQNSQKAKSYIFDNIIAEKNILDYDIFNLNNLQYSVPSMQRFSNYKSLGQTSWDYLKYIISIFPLYTTYFFGLKLSIGTKFAPYGNNIFSKSRGYSLSDKNNAFDKRIFTTNEWLAYINTNILYPPLADYRESLYLFASLSGSADLEIDKLAYLRINFLEKIQKVFPIQQLSDTVINPIHLNLLSVSQVENLLNAYAPFAPSTKFKLSTSSINPLIIDARLFSGTHSVIYTNPTSIEALTLRSFMPDLSACQKPPCYFLRGPGYLSGSCYYKNDAVVDPNVSSNQDVISKLDWKKYDDQINSWFVEIATCLFALKQKISNNTYNAYLTSIEGIINSAFQDISNLPNLRGVV